MRLTSGRPYRYLAASGYAVLLMAIPAHVWAASTPLPLGGPNAILGALAVLLSLPALLERPSAVKPLVPVAAVGLALLAWAILVYTFTDTFDLRRVGQTAVGIGIMVAVYVAVTDVRRARLMIGVLVLSILVSALFGLGMNYFGDPFLSVWLAVTEQDVVHLWPIWHGRIAGLSNGVATLGYQLAIAVPLAFAMLLYNPLSGRGRRIAWDAVLYGVLLTLIVVVVFNASRSVILGVACGAAVVAAPAVLRGLLLRRLYVILPLTAVGVAAFILVNQNVGASVPKEAALAMALSLVGPIESGDRPALESAVAELVEAIERRDSAAIDTALARLEAVTGRGRAEAIRDEILKAAFYRSEATGSGRVLSLSDRSARIRVPMMVTAVRYGWDHPLGTGAYRPDEAHIPGGTPEELVEPLLRQVPHNQLLHVLVLYGFPGLALIVLFYVYVLRSLLRSALSARTALLFDSFRSLLSSVRSALGSLDGGAAFLVSAIGGAVAAYVINSLLQPSGPFLGDWFHFFLIGLVFSVHRAVEPPPSRHSCVRGNSGSAGVSPASGSPYPQGNRITPGSRPVKWCKSASSC